MAGYLAKNLGAPGIERRAPSGGKDRGDITGVFLGNGDRVVIECKDVARTDLSGWWSEAQTEAANDGAPVAVVAHKRRGKGQPEDQWVTMDMNTFTYLVAASNVVPMRRGTRALCKTFRPQTETGPNPL